MSNYFRTIRSSRMERHSDFDAPWGDDPKPLPTAFERLRRRRNRNRALWALNVIFWASLIGLALIKAWQP